MTHLLSGATDGRSPLYVALCSAVVFDKFVEQLTSEAPRYKYQHQTRTRKNSFQEDIVSYEWSLSESIMLPPLDDDYCWIFKNYVCEARPIRLRLYKLRLVYFSQTKLIRADIKYDGHRYNYQTSLLFN